MKTVKIWAKCVIIALCITAVSVLTIGCESSSSSGGGESYHGTYKVVINGEESIVESGTILNKPVDPVMPESEGYTYTFDNWYVGDDVYDWSKPVKRNIEIEARYTRSAKQFDITYTINGVTKTGKFAYNTNLSDFDALGIPEKEDVSAVVKNRFTGWLEKGATTPLKDYIVKKNAEVEAVFEEYEDYGELIIDDMIVYTNAPHYFAPKFPIKGFEEELTYTFDKPNNIEIKNGTIKAVRVGSTTEVTAKSEHYETTFNVTVPNTVTPPNKMDPGFGVTDVVKYGHYYYTNPYKNIDSGDTFEYWVGQRRKQVADFNKAHGHIEVMFVGDSFFCPDHFWTNFYQKFAGKNAMTVGIGSSTTYEWDVWANELVFPYAPKNIVLHLGTNDLWSCFIGPKQVAQNLIDFIDKLNLILPETNVYCYSIEYRTYGASNKNIDDTNSDVREFNRIIEKYCKNNNKVTYLDSFTFSSTEDGMYTLPGFLRDGVHPTLENYDKYVELLGKYINFGDLTIEKKEPVYGFGSPTDGGDVNYDKNAKTFTFTGNVLRSRTYIFDVANNIDPGKYDFSASGTLKMNGFRENSFVEILLFDAPNNGWVEQGNKNKIDFIYQNKGTMFDLNIWGYGEPAVNSKYVWAQTDKDSFDFAITKTGRDVSITVNGVTKTLVTDAVSFGFGKENCDISITNFNFEMTLIK